MLSAHEMALHRIGRGMAAMALMTVPGPLAVPSVSAMVPPAAAAPLLEEDASLSVLPGEGEIRRKVPHVDVANGCEEGRNVSRSETVDADGRRHIRVRICQAQIEAQAHRAARAGLIVVRAQIAAAAKMSDRIRADILRDLDREIAGMDGKD